MTLLILPLPFLSFHLFLFFTWFYWGSALEVPVFIIFPLMWFTLSRILYWKPEILNIPPYNITLKIQKVSSRRALLEILLIYVILFLGFYHLYASFGLDWNKANEIDNWKPVAIGYGAFFFLGILLAPLIPGIVLPLMEIVKEILQKGKVFKRAFVVLAFYWMIIFFFAAVYRFIDLNIEDAFNKDFTGFIDVVYFSSITLATIGYGDFYPVHWLPKMIVCLEVFTGIVLLTVILGTTISLALENKKESQMH